MYRATTPIQSFVIPSNIFSEILDFVLTYENVDASGHRRKILEKRLNSTGISLDSATHSIQVTLTTTESNLFQPGMGYAQLRIKLLDGKIIASNIVSFEINRVLNDNVFV